MIIDPVALAQKLIQQPSISGEKDAGALDILEAALTELGFACHRLPFSGDDSYDVDNLYARLGSEGTNLCFAGHTDVVPVGDKQAWQADPFAGDIIGGMLVGRGAVDMKSAIAAWVAAISRYLDGHGNLEGSLSLLITGDEEAEAINGTPKMLNWLKERGEQVDVCVVGEPTNPEKLGEMIKIGRRGTVGFTLTVHGVQGHVAYPDQADNPITKLVMMLHSLKGTPLDRGTEFFQPSNLEVTSIDVGNVAGNVIPAQAVACFNVRFNDSYTGEEVVQWVRQHCNAVTSQYVLDATISGESFLTEPGFLSKTVYDAVEHVTGMRAELSTAGGTSDARFIKDICPVVEFGLINKTAHQVDEQVAVEDIKTLTAVYQEVITRYFVG